MQSDGSLYDKKSSYGVIEIRTNHNKIWWQDGSSQFQLLFNASFNPQQFLTEWLAKEFQFFFFAPKLANKG
jgi:hypothetical protein